MLALLAIGGMLWCIFVESKPSTGAIRTAMMAVLLIATSAELTMVAADVLRPSFVITIFLSNVWGSFDAILRYPVLQDMASLFVLKQFMLLLLKVVCSGLCFNDFEENGVWFFFALLLNVIALPFMYLVALPLDDELHHSRPDNWAEDVDVAIKAYRMITEPEVRRRCALTWKSIVRGFFRQLAGKSSTAATVIAHVDPILKRELSGRRHV